ncbi:MAG TPA: tyrosine-protein phosphatase [Acidimicrobiales bacterium]|nr:tyrosine-protein phosphatase [Acidimicrobiales bacterium]
MRDSPSSPIPATPTRHIELSGCCNFRDLGGYPTRDGRRTAWQRVFRADGLTDLTEDDLVVLEGIGIATVIDLRTDLETETRGRFPEHVDHIAYHHLPLTDTLPGEEQAPQWHDPGFVAERYRTMVTDGAAALSRAVEILADAANLPAVFHCSVGKDRTGVLAAVVLGLLGVADESIAQDYALSGEAMVRVLERLEREYPDADEIIDRYRPVILSADPASMLGLLDALRAEYGSFEAWAGRLGIEAAVARLRDVLLVPA